MRGSIIVRQLRDGAKRYHAAFRVNGKQRWKTFIRKKAAEQFLAETVKQVHEGSYTEVRPVTMSELFDHWLEQSLAVRLANGSLKRSTAVLYRSIISKWLRPALGELRSDQLHGRDLSKWLAQMADRLGKQDLSHATASNVDGLLRSILKWARMPAQRFLAHDPVLGLERIRRLKQERACPEPEQVKALLEAAAPPTDTVLRIAAFAGLRRGEIFGLQWGDIEWEKNLLRVRRAIVRGHVTTPKTTGSVRDVDVPKSLLTELLIYQQMCPPVGPDGYLFRDPATGSHVCTDTWSRTHLKPLLARLELTHLGLHSFRHYYASLLVNSGQNLKYVSRQLGHSNIQITLNIYSHLFRETSVEAMDKLDALIPKRPLPSNGDLTEHAEPALKSKD